MQPPEIRGTFHNAAGATFKKTGGTGKSQINVTFDNDGIVEVHTGELELEGRDSQAIASDGQFLIKTAGTLVLTRGDGTYSYYVGPAGTIKDFSRPITATCASSTAPTSWTASTTSAAVTTALSAPASNHTLNNITSLGFVNLPESNNASLTLNGVGRTFDQLYDVENHTVGALTINFATFNIGTAANPKNYTHTCNSHGLCTLAGTGVVQVWGTTTWFEGKINGVDRATDIFIANGPVLLDDSSLEYLDHRTFETNAGLTFVNGSMRVTSGTIHNSATGTWDVQCDCDVIEYLAVDSFFDNDGLLLKSVGSMSAESEFNLVLNNRKLVDLRQGVFNFDDGQGGTSPGDFAVAAGTLLRLHGNHLISGKVCGNASGVLDCAASASTGSLETWDGGTTHFSGVYHITGGTTVKGIVDNKTYWDIVPDSLGPLTVMDTADAYFTVGPVTTAYDVTVRDGALLELDFPQTTTFTVNGVYRQLGTSYSPYRAGTGALVLAGAGPHVWSGGYWFTGGKTVVNPGVALTIDTTTQSALICTRTRWKTAVR